MAERVMRSRAQRPDYRHRVYEGNSVRTEQRHRAIQRRQLPTQEQARIANLQRRELQGHQNPLVQQNRPPPPSYRLVSFICPNAK